METKQCIATKDGIYCLVDNITINGASLASVLNREIDKGVDDNNTRGSIVARVAKAGGIAAGTLNQILNGNINCPPLRRLQGFSRSLNISVGTLRRAAERDGCEYNET